MNDEEEYDDYYEYVGKVVENFRENNDYFSSVLEYCGDTIRSVIDFGDYVALAELMMMMYNEGQRDALTSAYIQIRSWRDEIGVEDDTSDS